MIAVAFVPAAPIFTELCMRARRRRSPYARTLTLVDPSAIVPAPPFAHRHATRIPHARHAAHLAAPAVAFNSQAQPLTH